MAIQALGLEVGRLRPATTNARGSVGGHRVDLIWRWPGESDPFSKVTVAFDDPIGPAGLRVGRNLRRVPRPAVRRLGDTVVVGARRRRELDEWLTPRRSSVLGATLATSITRQRLVMKRTPPLEGADRIEDAVRSLVADADALA